MRKQTAPKPNYLGVGGWVWGGKYKLERYLYLFHRISGLYLMLFIMLHLFTTFIFRIQSKDVWAATIVLFQHPWLKIIAYLTVGAAVYHAMNGLRLALLELGFALGRPALPVFPYSDALRRKRPLTMVFMALAIVIAFIFFFGFV